MTTTRQVPAAFDDTASGWDRSLCAFLAEKERRSGSRRTVESYARMLQDFFERLGSRPTGLPARTSSFEPTASGCPARSPRPSLSARGSPASRRSTASHPHGDRRREPAPGTGAAEDHALAAARTQRRAGADAALGHPETPTGLRDRAIILTLVLTVRRRAEVLNLRAGNLSLDEETVFYEYRGKGAKRGRRELPRPAYEAIVQALAAFGFDLHAMEPEASLWPGVGADSITTGTA